MSGQAEIMVAGGQESMSGSHHSAFLRNGIRMGDGTLTDTMIKDGLWDAFNNYHMGTTAENVAKAFSISREDQDQFAVASQHKASAAQKEGRFKDEIVAVTVKGRKGDVIVELNRQAVSQPEDVKKIQSTLKPGDAVAFHIMRQAVGSRGGGEWTSAFVAGKVPDTGNQ